MAKFTEVQQDANWDNLNRDQKAYFNRLAEDDPERTGQAFFEDEVPVSLQDDPEKLDVFLNGGTVTTQEWIDIRGRAGGEWVEVEHTIEDKDWSHDVSKHNGGSDSADNGRFEDASTNRARGSRNSTEAEQQTADAQNEYDADVLERGTIIEELEEVATASQAGLMLDIAGGFLEAGLGVVMPVLGGGYAAKKAYDHFDDPVDKAGFSALAGGAAVAYLASPLGAPTIGLYMLYKAGKGVHYYAKKAMS